MVYNTQLNYRELFRKLYLVELFFSDPNSIKLPPNLIPVITGHISTLSLNYPSNWIVLSFDSLDVIKIKYLDVNIQLTRFSETKISLFLQAPTLKLELLSDFNSDFYHQSLLRYYSQKIPNLFPITLAVLYFNRLVPETDIWVLDISTAQQIRNPKK